MMKILEKIVWKMVTIGASFASLALSVELEKWIYYNVYPGALGSGERTAWTVVIFFVMATAILFYIDAIKGKIAKAAAIKKEENEKIKEIIANYDEFVAWKTSTEPKSH